MFGGGGASASGFLIYFILGAITLLLLTVTASLVFSKEIRARFRQHALLSTLLFIFFLLCAFLFSAMTYDFYRINKESISDFILQREMKFEGMTFPAGTRVKMAVEAKGEFNLQHLSSASFPSPVFFNGLPVLDLVRIMGYKTQGYQVLGTHTRSFILELAEDFIIMGAKCRKNHIVFDRFENSHGMYFSRCDLASTHVITDKKGQRKKVPEGSVFHQMPDYADRKSDGPRLKAHVDEIQIVHINPVDA